MLLFFLEMNVTQDQFLTLYMNVTQDQFLTIIYTFIMERAQSLKPLLQLLNPRHHLLRI